MHQQIGYSFRLGMFWWGGWPWCWEKQIKYVKVQWKKAKWRDKGKREREASMRWQQDEVKMRLKWAWKRAHLQTNNVMPSWRQFTEIDENLKKLKKRGTHKKKRNQFMPFGIFFWPNRQISNTLAVISAVQAIPLSLLSCLSETNRELSATFKYAIIPASVGLVI